MTHRLWTVLLGAQIVFGQGTRDLSGVWTNATITPLERPTELAGKRFFTPQEAANYEKETNQRNDADTRESNPEADVNHAYIQFWWDRGTKVVSGLRTSLVVDPPDGRIPPLTPAAQKRMAEQLAYARERSTDGPENRLLSERCLLWPTAGPPMLPSFCNNEYQIVQTPDSVAILIEMIHDVRMIPLDGRPHLPATIRQWMGASRGHWEGNTLVVDTTNFSNKTRFRGADENLHLTERFTRVHADTILYEFTVDDPTAFSKPRTAQIPMAKTKGPVFEYACHEGNYAMVDILAGARAAEKSAGK
jgi:hypothetical protein